MHSFRLECKTNRWPTERPYMTGSFSEFSFIQQYSHSSYCYCPKSVRILPYHKPIVCVPSWLQSASTLYTSLSLSPLWFTTVIMIHLKCYILMKPHWTLLRDIWLYCEDVSLRRHLLIGVLMKSWMAIR